MTEAIPLCPYCCCEVTIREPYTECKNCGEWLSSGEDIVWTDSEREEDQEIIEQYNHDQDVIDFVTRSEENDG